MTEGARKTDIGELLLGLRAQGLEIWAEQSRVMCKGLDAMPEAVHLKIERRSAEILEFLSRRDRLAASTPSPECVFDACIVDAGPVGADLTRLVLSVDSEIRGSYVVPGQYILLDIGEGAGAAFALASSPGDEHWEIIVRRGKRTADALCQRTSARVSKALGRGFPLATAKGRELLVAVAGSGIGPARPVLSARASSGDASRTRLYLGTRSAGDLPLRDELSMWSTAGTELVVCASRDADTRGACAFRVAKGRVPDVIRHEFAALAGAGVTVFVGGPPPMVTAMRELARQAGMDDEKVCTNV